MNELEPADYRSPVGVDPEELRNRQSRKPPRHRTGEPFLKGPIPWPWLQSAMQQKGKALHVALMLWKESGIRRSRTIRFNLSAAAKIGIHRDTARRGLRALESAQLVTVTHRPGRAPVVTLRDTPPSPVDEPAF